MKHKSSLKMNELLIYVTIWMNLQENMLRKKEAISKGHITHGSTDIKFLK